MVPPTASIARMLQSPFEKCKLVVPTHIEHQRPKIFSRRQHCGADANPLKTAFSTRTE